MGNTSKSKGGRGDVGGGFLDFNIKEKSRMR
jgi:hypothetical protein